MGFMLSVAIKAPMRQINLGYIFRLKLLTSRSHILIGIEVEYQNQEHGIMVSKRWSRWHQVQQYQDTKDKSRSVTRRAVSTKKNDMYS